MENIYMHVFRHGPKRKYSADEKKPPDKDIGLSPDGERIMRELGEKISIHGAVVGEHSEGYVRTRDSVRLLIEGAVGEGGVVCSDPGLGIDMERMFSPAQFNAWKNGICELGEDGWIEEWLQQGRERPDADTWSPYEIACGQAWSLWSTMSEGASKNVFKVTHNGYNEAFIKELCGEQILHDPVVRNVQTFVQRIGGVLRCGEIGCLYVYRKSDNSLSLFLHGKEYAVDISKVENMAQEFINFARKNDINL